MHLGSLNPKEMILDLFWFAFTKTGWGRIGGGHWMHSDILLLDVSWIDMGI